MSGCAGQGTAQGPEPRADRAGGTSAPAGPTDAESLVPTDAESLAPGDAESLPPGDPGPDAPSVPDPGAASDDHGDEPARRTVPPSALLTAEAVGMAAGGGWQRHGGGGDECVIPEGAVGLKTVSYGGAGGSLVVETVATYPGHDAADAAVAAMGEMAADCGWRPSRDPRLGSASVAATEASRSLVAVSVEGVVVLLIGSGPVARDSADWASLVDLAVGSSCAAAPDGCH